MKTYKEIITEARSKKIVFTFGRMNPMTKGHEKLVNAVQKVAKSVSARPIILLSRTQDKKKNPLDFSTKFKFMKKFFPQVELLNDPKANTPFTALERFAEMGYTDVVMVVGSDRVDHFKKILTPYTTEFNTFSVVSAGERDPDAEGTTGISGTKMREYALNDDFESFKAGLPDKATNKEAIEIFNKVKKALQ